MRCFIITLTNDGSSFAAARTCLASIDKNKCEVEPFIFQGTTPDTLDDHWNWFLKDIKWTYPPPGQSRWDLITGLKLTGYPSKDERKRYSCLLSHVRLWHLCIDIGAPIMILEHDSVFIRKFKNRYVENDWPGGVLGLNSPLKATRKAQLFHNKLVKSHSNNPNNPFSILPTPWIEDEPVPQGLAGNSAYIIKPFAAKALLNRMKDIGAWPNDALMCKQQFPWLQVIYPYFTEVQGLRSTTSL